MNAIPSAKIVAKYHHEHFDGNGYPEGLKGEEIPLEARIVSVADVFDALSSQRCYKEAWSIEDAFNEIEKCSGSQFDPEIVKAFLEIKERITAIYTALKDPE